MGIIEAIRYYGYRYINPFVCTFGILCNILNLTVLTNPRLKESPFTFLTGLATFDLLTLLFTLTTTLTRGYWIQYTNDVNVEFILKKLEKKVFLPSANLFSAMSVSVTVALTIERYFFVKFPMHASRFCTANNARRIILILFGLIFVFRLPMYFFFDVIKVDSALNDTNSYTNLLANNTTPQIRVETVKYYEKFQKLYFILSLVIFEIMPFFLLSIFNLNLVLLLKKSNKEFELLRSHSENCIYRVISNNAILYKNNSQIDSVNKKPDTFRKYSNDDPRSKQNGRGCIYRIHSKSTRRKKDEIKLTRTLIPVVFLVVLSEISSIVTYEKITELLIGNSYPSYMGEPYKLQVFISNLIVLIVHSVDFLFYCAFNEKYFKIFMEKYNFFFKWCRKFKK